VQPVRPTRDPVFPGQAFWTVGFPAGQDGGMDAQGQLSVPVEHGRLIAHSDGLPGFFIEGGYSGAPILNGHSAVLFGMAALAVREKEKRTAFILPMQALEYAWPPLARPYQGLAAFRESDARFFKGRNRYVQELADKLSKSPLIAVVGPSGGGKSSLIRAGLFPLLRSQQDWRVVVFRPAWPSANPFANLIMALDDRPRQGASLEVLAQETQNAEALASSLLETPNKLMSILQRLTKADGRPILLVGDQFEELFTAVSDPHEHDYERSIRTKFVRSLAAGFHEVRTCKCILTIRADYMGEVLKVSDLANLLRDADVKLGPMSPGELRETIVKPATELGVQIGDELVSELLAAVGSVPDALPLLEFTLTELWSQQRARRIERVPSSEVVDNPASIVQGPLIRHADRVFDDLAREFGETAFRNVMVGLVWISDPDSGGQDTRRVRKRSSFFATEWRVVEQLASEHREARLITMRRNEGDQEATAEIAHEVLIRQWPRLQCWLNEDRAFRLWLQTVERDARVWRKGKEPDLLHRGGRLQEALRWRRDRPASDLDSVVDFIEAAEKQERHESEARQAAESERLRALSEKVEAEERARVEAERRADQERVAAAEALRLQDEANVARRQAEREKARARRELVFTLGASGFALVVGAFLFLKRSEAERLIKLTLATETRALSAFSRVAAAEHRPVESVKLGLAAWPRDEDDGRPRLESTLSAVSAAIATERLPLREFVHDGPVNRAVLMKQHDRILSWSNDNTLRLWDAATGHQIGPDMRHEGPVRGAIFSDDERRILSWSADGTLRLWDAATGQQIDPEMRHEGPVRGAIFTKDQRRILSWSADGTLRLWDAATGQQIGPDMRHEGPVGGAIFTKDQRRILSWSADGTLRLWDAATGQQIDPEMRHEGPVGGAIFTKDQRRILSWSADGTMRLWDAATGRQIGLAMRQLAPVDGAIFTNGGLRILSWSAYVGFRVGAEKPTLEGTLMLWDAATGERIGPEMRHQGVVGGAIFTTDDRRILSWSSDNTLRLWDVATGQQIGPDMRHQGPVGGAIFTTDGGRILSWSADKTLRLWDAATGQQVGPDMRHQGPIGGAIFTADEHRILSWSADKTLRLWNNVIGQQIGPAMRHDNDVLGAIFSRNEQRVLSWSRDNTLRLWDAATGQQIGPDMRHNNDVLGAIFSRNEQRVLSWSRDHTLRLWDVATGQQIGPDMRHEAPVGGAIFIDGERRILSWSADRTLRLWDAATGQLIADMRHRGAVLGAAFSKEGRRVLSWSGDGRLRLWDAATAQLIAPMPHRGPVLGAAFSRDEHRILSWSADGTLRLWDAATGQQIGPAMRTAGQSKARFSPRTSDASCPGQPTVP
jgi:WD40 repeat protein